MLNFSFRIIFVSYFLPLLAIEHIRKEKKIAQAEKFDNFHNNNICTESPPNYDFNLNSYTQEKPSMESRF